MQKTFKFRLYPSKLQEQQMQSVLDKCRFVYNKMLEDLKKQESPDKLALQNSIPELKKEHPELNGIYSKVLQYEVYRLFSNLKALARLKRNGRKVGRLRFKGKDWFKTFVYNQSGFQMISTGKRCQKLHLSKIGEIPIRVHRPVNGEIKQVTIKRHPSGKWYAALSVEYGSSPKSILPEVRKAVGIDLGTIHFVYDSGGNAIKHPRFMAASLRRLRILQQKLSRKKKRSSNRQKQKIKVAKQFEKTCNQRNDFLHKISKHYVSSYDIIAVEDLNVRELINISHNARTITDASWSRFIQMLSYKAESAGKTVVKVNPRGTTQMCSSCGKEVPKQLWNRIHQCDCGLVTDRDHNAAINILNQGLRKLRLGQELPEVKPLREGTATDKNTCQQVPLMKEEAADFNRR